MEIERLIEGAIRTRTCRICGGDILSGEWHFRFSYRDGAWTKNLNICRDCVDQIGVILQAVTIPPDLEMKTSKINLEAKLGD